LSGAPLVLAVVAAVLAAFAVGFSALSYARVLKLAEPHRRFLAALGEIEFPEDLTRYLELLGTVHRRVEDNQQRVDQLAEALLGTISGVGLVKFDAFDHMGGMMSFSLALVDYRGNGVLFTGLHGRDSFDAYCRRVQGGRPEHDVMPEELEALEQALDNLGRRE